MSAVAELLSEFRGLLGDLALVLIVLCVVAFYRGRR